MVGPGAAAESADRELLARAVVAVVRAGGVGGRETGQACDWRSLQVVQRDGREIATAYRTAEQDWLDTLRRGGPAPSPWLGGLAVDWTQTSVPHAIRQAGGAVWAPYYREIGSA